MTTYQSENICKLATALLNVQRTVQPIAKDAENTFTKSWYASLSSVMDFRWQLYKVAPLEQHADNTAVLEAGLAEEVQGLGGTLFDEVAKSADDIWRRVYHGKTEVTHKALSPLRTLHVNLLDFFDIFCLSAIFGLGSIPDIALIAFLSHQFIPAISNTHHTAGH